MVLSDQSGGLLNSFFSPDSAWVITANGTGVMIWDSATGDLLAKLSDPGKSREITGVASTPPAPCSLLPAQTGPRALSASTEFATLIPRCAPP
jgi:WD40 repeat protein